MLSPEEAQRRLAERRLADFDARIRERASRLPRRARDAAEVLVAPEPGTRAWHVGGPERETLGERIDALGASDRRALFQALFPKAGVEVHHAWDALARGPYGTGARRRGFRAPNDPQLSQEARANWLESLLRATSGYEEDVVWLAEWAEHL